jgi:hypothetical protein
MLSAAPFWRLPVATVKHFSCPFKRHLICLAWLAGGGVGGVVCVGGADVTCVGSEMTRSEIFQVWLPELLEDWHALK